MAHRKGKSYLKTIKKFGIEDKTLSEIFDQILKDTIEFLEFLKTEFLD